MQIRLLHRMPVAPYDSTVHLIPGQLDLNADDSCFSTPMTFPSVCNFSSSHSSNISSNKSRWLTGPNKIQQIKFDSNEYKTLATTIKQPIILPYSTSGTVIELSAMFVDKMILRRSSTCMKIDCCSSVLINECKMNNFHLPPIRL